MLNLYIQGNVMKDYENMSVEEELDNMSKQIQHILDNLDNITEDDIDPETLALAKAAVEKNKHNKLTAREIAERFFPED